MQILNYNSHLFDFLVINAEIFLDILNFIRYNFVFLMEYCKNHLNFMVFMIDQ